jgi:hypothetical protein
MDFRVMEIAVKLNTKAKVTKVNYNDFCAWFGNAIEPKESFLSATTPKRILSLKSIWLRQPPKQRMPRTRYLPPL